MERVLKHAPLHRVLDAEAREASVDAWRTIFAAGPSRSETTTATATATARQEVNPPSHPTLIAQEMTAPPNTATHTLPSAHPSPAPIQHEYPVIADENIERSVAAADDDEEDGYFGLMGDGLGEDDENDLDEHDDTTAGASQAGERRPLPTWLKNAFNSKVNESARSRRGPDGVPPLYRDHKTFWFPQQSTFFLLRNSVTPQDLYNPRFFLWDPAALCLDGIPCPDCHVGLKPHGNIPRPRRCVDIDGSFWMIGYRYRCFNCVQPGSRKNTVTFRSWDPRILAVLPRSLACEFPAQLSHRSALSTSALNLMRVCVQNGMGAKQFSDALRVQHIERYDRLHLQYLNWLAECRGLNDWLGIRYKAFLPYADRSPDGYAGFVPSAQWLRDIYDDFIEEHRAEFDQHMAMLTAEICAIDHSHKVMYTDTPAISHTLSNTHSRSRNTFSKSTVSRYSVDF